MSLEMLNNTDPHSWKRISALSKTTILRLTCLLTLQVLVIAVHQFHFHKLYELMAHAKWSDDAEPYNATGFHTSMLIMTVMIFVISLNGAERVNRIFINCPVIIKLARSLIVCTAYFVYLIGSLAFAAELFSASMTYPDIGIIGAAMFIAGVSLALKDFFGLGISIEKK